MHKLAREVEYLTRVNAGLEDEIQDLKEQLSGRKRIILCKRKRNKKRRY